MFSRHLISPRYRFLILILPYINMIIPSTHIYMTCLSARARRPRHALEDDDDVDHHVAMPRTPNDPPAYVILPRYMAFMG